MRPLWQREPESLELWLAIATGGLCRESRERIAQEITEHYRSAVEEAEQTMPATEVRLAALRGLGSPTIAYREFRKSHWTEGEVRSIRAWTCSHSQAQRWGVAALLTAGSLYFATFGLALPWVLTMLGAIPVACFVGPRLLGSGHTLAALSVSLLTLWLYQSALILGLFSDEDLDRLRRNAQIPQVLAILGMLLLAHLVILASYVRRVRRVTVQPESLTIRTTRWRIEPSPDTWLAIATEGLCRQSRESIRQRIFEQLDFAARDTEGLSSPGRRRDDALRSLGDPAVAHRAFRKTHWTEEEARTIRLAIGPRSSTEQWVIAILGILFSYLVMEDRVLGSFLRVGIFSGVVGLVLLAPLVRRAGYVPGAMATAALSAGAIQLALFDMFVPLGLRCLLYPGVFFVLFLARVYCLGLKARSVPDLAQSLG